MNLATRRLIDASATLPPADRALLSLWTQRGLDDTAMARMTGMSPETIVERRERIVSALSDELGLPPQEISGALAGLADSAATAEPETPEAAPPDAAEAGRPGASDGDRPFGAEVAGSSAPAADAPAGAPRFEPASTAKSQAQDEPAGAQAQAQHEPEIASPAGSASSEHRRLILAMLVIVVAVVAIVVIVLLAGGGSAGSAHTASAPASSTTTSTSASAAAPATTASTSAPAPPPAALVPLPGGDARASGTVTLSGSGSGRALTVHVHGLPDAGGDHYEVFLYDSIVDSEALGALRAGTGTFHLPADAAHYAFIDISRQAAGDPLPDGASVLRSPSPIHTS